MGSRVLRFRITEHDYHKIRVAAQADALTISTLIRYAVADWIACGEEPLEPTGTECSSLCPRCPPPAPRS